MGKESDLNTLSLTYSNFSWYWIMVDNSFYFDYNVCCSGTQVLENQNDIILIAYMKYRKIRKNVRTLIIIQLGMEWKKVKNVYPKIFCHSLRFIFFLKQW